MSILKIPTAKAFEPLLTAARYKAAYGGRGSGKSHFFGELLIEICQAERGTSAVCIREAQRTLAQSSKRLIESKIAGLGLGHQFKIFSDKIEAPGGGLIIFRGMQDHTADSIKSLEGFKIAWVDEAQNLSARSLSLLRPTIRDKGSQLWASWNPYNVPLLGGIDFWDTIAPNSSFIFPQGQAISRTTYAAAFARWGTTYGPGDGSTTFNVPDKTGRVSAMKEASGVRLTSTYFGGNSTVLGAVGGSQSFTLAVNHIPAGVPSSNPSQAISVTTNQSTRATNNSSSFVGGGSVPMFYSDIGASLLSTAFGNNSISVTSTNVSQQPAATVQPTIVCNYIIRII